jgi:hypothetical protein
MPNYLIQERQEEFLNAVSNSQQAVVEVVKTWVDAVKSVSPKVPSPVASFAGALPKPEEVVTTAYDFAEKLLAGQRRFAGDLLQAAAPLLPGRASDTGPDSSFE